VPDAHVVFAGPTRLFVATLQTSSAQHPKLPLVTFTSALTYWPAVPVNGRRAFSPGCRSSTGTGTPSDGSGVSASTTSKTQHGEDNQFTTPSCGHSFPRSITSWTMETVKPRNAKNQASPFVSWLPPFVNHTLQVIALR
jgi:hypothetical protein